MRAAPVVAALAVLVAACSGPRPAADRRAAGPSTLHWTTCDGGAYQCATLTVPLDEAHPGRATIRLGLVRRPAAGRRIGALFVNPGGPGGSAVQYVEGVSGSFPEVVRDRFDIVGVDPRGVGRSTPLHCDEHAAAMYQVDPTFAHDPQAGADRAALLSRSRRFVDDCRRSAGALLPHLGTDDDARDLDRVRAALGDRQLSYLGFSYGTVLGQVYADRFPTRVRAMVLDGVADPARLGVAGARIQAAGFEHALRAFAAGCRRDRSCPLRPDPIAAVDRLVARAEARPIPAKGATRAAGPAEVVLAMIRALYHETDWPQLAGAVDAGLAGDGRGLVALADEYIGEVPIAPYFAQGCLDTRWPPVDGLLRAAAEAGRDAPHFGEAVVVDYVRCSLWPVRAEPLATPKGRGVAPIVLVSTTGDPATPYAEGTAVAHRFPGSRVITYEGDQHTITFQGEACVDGPVARYLTKLTLPGPTLRCA